MSEKNIVSTTKPNLSFFYLALLFSLLTIIFIVKTIPRPGLEKKIYEENQNTHPSDSNGLLNPTIDPSKLDEKPGRYIDKDLRFSFSYPVGANLKKCDGKPCITIEDYSVRVEPLEIDISKSDEVTGPLLDIDFFCNYESEELSVSCQNLFMKELTTVKGVKGFILYREKYVRETNLETGEMKNTTYKERAFLLPIPGEKYKSVAIYIDLSLPKNQEVLNEIVDSFELL